MAVIVTSAFETIAAIIEAAEPPPIAEELIAESAAAASTARAPARQKSTSAGAAGRPVDLPSDPDALTPALSRKRGRERSAAAVAPPAAAAGAGEKDASSQTGASGGKSDGRKGGGRRAGKRRGADRHDRNVEDQRALDLRLAFFPLTDLGNAERFRERNRGALLWCPAIGWLYWDGKRWCRDGADEKVRIAEHECVRGLQDEAAALVESEKDILLDQNPKTGEETWLSDKLSRWGRTSEGNSKIVVISKNAAAYLYIETAQLDADPFKINVSNGTLVIRRSFADEATPLPNPPPQGGRERSAEHAAAWVKHGDYIRFKPHDPNDLITKISPVTFDREADCPRFDTFLGEVQGNADNRRFLMQWKGLSITGDVSEQRLCVFWGKGKNGKSVFEDTTAFVGGDYAESVPVETFLAEGRGRNAGQATPDLAILPGVRMLRTSEPKQNAQLDEALIKLATGGEPIIARHLNRDYFKFYPSFKLTISGNNRPNIKGADDGIWRRMILVPWLYTVPAEKRDARLVEKLKGEGSGILNRLLDGLVDWLEHGLLLPDDIDRATKEYRRDSDPLGRFLEGCVVAAPGERVQSSELHKLFVAWCAANGATKWSNKGFTNALTERGYHKKQSDVMWWLDIKALHTVDDFVDSDGNPKRVSSSDDAGDKRGGGGDDVAF